MVQIQLQLDIPGLDEFQLQEDSHLLFKTSFKTKMCFHLVFLCFKYESY